MYPKRKDRFVAWAKDMVEGATVDRPRLTGTRKRTKTGRRRKRRTKRSNHAKKE